MSTLTSINNAEINQRYVIASVRASTEYARNQPLHRRNLSVYYAAKTYNDAFYEEGSE